MSEVLGDAGPEAVPEDPVPDAEEVAAALRMSIGMVMRRLRQTQPEGDLTLPESSVLSRLDRAGPATASELARADRISPQSMGATVAALERRGLVGRHRDPADGRRVVLSASASGSDVLRSRRSARTQQIAQALRSGFTPAELGRLLAAAPLLERLAERL